MKSGAAHNHSEVKSLLPLVKASRGGRTGEARRWESAGGTIGVERQLLGMNIRTGSQRVKEQRRGNRLRKGKGNEKKERKGVEYD